MYTEFSDDGCPNNCKYCKKYDYECIYSHMEGGEIGYNHNSPLLNTKYKCAKCGKKLMGSETYSYKDFDFCEDCFDKGREEVKELIAKAHENAEARRFVPADPSLVPVAEQKRMSNGAWEIAAKESIYEAKLREGKLL